MPWSARRSWLAATAAFFVLAVASAGASAQPAAGDATSLERVSSVVKAPAPPAPPAARTPTAEPSPPEDLGDLAAWIDYKRSSHRPSLPDEARLFYRRGILERNAGHHQDAMRLLRGAAELDPSFVAPHLTLASWALPRDPSQALLRYAVVLDLARKSFLVQVELVANLLFFTLHGLFVGLLATAFVVVCLHQAELRHMWQERLSRLLSPASARVWAVLLFALPFVAGIGIAVPTAIFMGLLWPMLRVRERVLYVTLLLALVAAPFGALVLGRVATPLHEQRGPLYGITALPGEAWSAARQSSLETLAVEHPNNPYVQFGLGWMARQGRDYTTAERAYRRALALWPQDARVMNNLANILVAEGRIGAAIDLYRSAISADPENAAAHFNLSQVYTRQFEYRAASEAAARASALDFELVKTQQALGTEDGVLPTADQWIAPATFWATVLEPALGEHPARAMPPAWRGHLETSGFAFTAVVVLLAIGSVIVGMRWQQEMPLRACRNCGRVVCRRCSQRRREMALCPACAKQEAQAESPEFAQVLLARIRGRRERGARVARTVIATVLPGFGLLAHHRVFRATLLIASTLLLAATHAGARAPFSYHSWPGLGEGALPTLVVIGLWMAIYGNSVLGYLAHEARVAAESAASAPVRSRPSSTGRITAKAA